MRFVPAPISRSRSRSSGTCSSTATRIGTFLDRHAHGAEALRARAAEWTFERAADVAGVSAKTLEQVASWYASTSPAVVRCGWGLERNRNGGNAVLAVLALPAVGGKFGVRGGGYTMSSSAAFGLKSTQWVDADEPPTRLVNMNHLGRALLEYDQPPVKALFVYNCNPLATMPDQRRVLAGLERDDLFTVVYEQVMTDTARYADVILPATTFLENYDIAKGYGSISLQLVRPVIDVVGEARPNPEVFGELAHRLGVSNGRELATEAETLLHVVSRMSGAIGEPLMASGAADPPHGGQPVQFVDVFPKTEDGKINLFPESIAQDAPAGLYGYQPDPATAEFPLASDLAGQRSDDLLHARRAAAAPRGAADSSVRCRGARHRRRRGGPRVQLARRGPVPGGGVDRCAGGDRVAAEGPLAQEHVQRSDRERPRARHADGHR